MHIGLVQVAFKPLTLGGLPESFIAALRDGRNQNWKKSLIGTIQTSLAYGPVPSRASTSQIEENYRCDNIKIDRDNIARPMPMPNSDLDITEC
ncbi:hypothetical protein KY290_036759 [Solanum tuberosum]|uniref:Uncharacterized protein n=1 Tax=Solanum tuberosum TaxID=4113 RepID=A0ABQ7TTM4_SOLTU|nr:hypothetical protein KY285_036079 [Solanum tuberosum]KAH0738054.1 hypothetical protein KY290_036759 [Solanum tuberosum]